MIEIRGRVPLEKYSGSVPVSSDTQVRQLFDILGIPEDLRGYILAIRNGKIIQHSDIVTDGSALDLIIIPEGG